nr:hypothetical protein CFP56_77985 [Quercus suber]
MLSAVSVYLFDTSLGGRLPKFRWDVIWLPFGPLGGAGVCLYVDHLLLESSEEIRKLRAYTYSYKAY